LFFCRIPFRAGDFLFNGSFNLRFRVRFHGITFNGDAFRVLLGLRGRVYRPPWKRQNETAIHHEPDSPSIHPASL
jgi:hypothetical protein